VIDLTILKQTKGLKGLVTLLTSEDANLVDHELPFAMMLFSLMAAGGISIYESWKRLKSIRFLPTIQKDAKDFVCKVKVLGYDPLTIMYAKAEETKSKLYRDFLAGYVSCVKSGSNVTDFLKSKLRSIFELKAAAENRSVERLGSLVEIYAVILIVSLCINILYVVLSSNGVFEALAFGGLPSSSMVLNLAVLITPIISMMLILAARSMRRSNLVGLEQPYRLAIVPAIIALILFMLTFVFSISFIGDILGYPGLVSLCLLIVSIPPSFSYWRIARLNAAAEEAMPSFVRDVTEARKAGLSPEKSIIHASKRKGYSHFSKVLELVRNQIVWGIPLRKIFENIKNRVLSWTVLVDFLILVEAIEIGGGSTEAFETLAEYSEKSRDIEKNKRELLKPYIVLAFIWSILIAFTTSVVATTVTILGQISMVSLGNRMTLAMQEQISTFSIGIIFQCWLSGFFIGQVTEGSLAAGFKYSAMLVIVAILSLIISQNILQGMFTM
jgi:flagellar protein FlaJ